MSTVATEATLRHGRMLIGKWSAVLCVAAQAELVHVCGSQIMARCSTVRVVAIGAAHLAFAQRVMIGHAHLRPLRLVTAQAGFIRHRPGLNGGICFRRDEIYVSDALQRRVEGGGTLIRSLYRGGVNLVAIDAANHVCRMHPAHPVPCALVPGMAAQADAIGLGCGSMLEGNNLRDIASALHVETARSMALLTLNSLLRVKGMLEILAHIRVARRAGLCSDRGSSLNLRMLFKRPIALVGTVHS